MNPQDVVSPISLPPKELERFQKRWVIFLERQGITADRQPTTEEVADWCFAAGVTFSDPPSTTQQMVEEIDRLTPEGSAEERPPAELEERETTQEEADKVRKKLASPTLTPEQDALSKAPWTPEDRRAFEQWCSQQGRRGPDMYSPREQANWIRQRRGVPLLPPDPPPAPMIWHTGEYSGRVGPYDHERANDGFKRPGSFSTP